MAHGFLPSGNASAVCRTLSTSQVQHHLQLERSPFRWHPPIPVMYLQLAKQRDPRNLPWTRREWRAGVPLDLSEGESVRPPRFLNLQLEGIFIGVMLHDVVVHVHQNPGRGEAGQVYSRLLVWRQVTAAWPRTSCDTGDALFTNPPSASIPSSLKRR